MYASNVKHEFKDETFNLLLADNSTMDWNPIIFAIFYQKLDILKYFCEHPRVYVRNCLTTPFLIESENCGEYEETSEEKFIREKTEIFCLILAAMLQNKHIFTYLWKQCAYIWNDIHLVLLTNFLFDSVWSEGIKNLYTSANTKQIFTQMNLFEKEKFLKFCDKSVTKIPNIIYDFRYSMSFNPYNVYYLPILAPTDDLI